MRGLWLLAVVWLAGCQHVIAPPPINGEIRDLRSGEVLTAQQLVNRLMDARRQVGAALKAKDDAAERAARAGGDAAKRALGERGPVWWTDGAPDYNRRMVVNTPYAAWYAALDGMESE